MRCSTCREILSAHLDGEATPQEVSAAGTHLARCPACAHQRDVFERRHRSIRLAPAEPVPDLTARIVAAAARPPARTARDASRIWPLGLALVALAQLLVAAGHLGGDHVLRDQAAWEAALAAGYGWAAWRPTRAGGLVPVAGVLTVLLLANAGGAPDTAGGHHLLAPLGLALLVLASWRPRPRALVA